MDNEREKDGPQPAAAPAETERVTISLDEQETFDKGFVLGYRCAIRGVLLTTIAAILLYAALRELTRE